MSDDIVALDLDWDLLNHLALPNSVGRLRAEAITSDLIEDDLVNSVFEWQMHHYREYGKPATASVLEDEFDDIAIDEPLTTIDDLIGRLRARFMRNNGMKTLEELIEQYNNDPLDVAHLMYEKGRELTTLVTRRGESYGTGDYDRSMAEYDRMVVKGKGPSFGFDEVDNHFHGQRGLTFLVGAPKSYKSWFTVNAAVANVLDGKAATLYSLELPAHEAYNRVLHCAANVPWWKFLRGALQKEDRAALREAAEVLDGSGVLRVVKPEPGERDADRMIHNARDLGADAVFIDQLQYMEAKGGRTLGANNDTGDYWDVCGRLRDYSDSGPIWIVHQFNRSVMFADEMPSMQQAKGSAAIEETATTALGLWANKDMRSSNVVEMGTLASRNYEWYSWEFGVRLSHECHFEMIGQVEE